jgi:hypothetical protein
MKSVSGGQSLAYDNQTEQNQNQFEEPDQKSELCRVDVEEDRFWSIERARGFLSPFASESIEL